MIKINKKYPNYNLVKHFGKGTKSHLENINKFWPVEIHRKTFCPIKKKFKKNKYYYIYEKKAFWKLKIFY